MYVHFVICGFIELFMINDNHLTECRDHTYGGVSIAFLGDFLQLEPVGNNSALNHPEAIFWEQALTTMVELQGTHRFNDCNVMKDIMPRLRVEGLSDDIRKILNERVMDMSSIPVDDIKNLRYACFYNKKRSELNRAVFISYLEGKHSKDKNDPIPDTAIVIKCNASWSNGQTLSFAHQKYLYEKCQDCDVKDSMNHFADPFLCCISNCPMMGTTNTNVNQGDANGTQFIFEKAVLKAGREPCKIQIDGYWCYAVNVDDVDHLLLRWSDDCRFQGTYKMRPKNAKFTVKFVMKQDDQEFPVKCPLNITHFPVILDHATTGHKLQGKSLKSLVISQWKNVKNWVYVVLSRVRELKGLFFLSKIPDDIEFRPDERYTQMMNRLRSSVLATSNDIADLVN